MQRKIPVKNNEEAGQSPIWPNSRPNLETGDMEQNSNDQCGHEGMSE